MGDIGQLLDAPTSSVDTPAKPAPVMDLPKIEFEAPRSLFKESKHQNTDLEILRAVIPAQLEKLIRLDKTRAVTAESKARFTAILAAIETHRIPLSALWVFDFASQAKDWDVTAANDRSWQLEAIQLANERMRTRRQ